MPWASLTLAPGVNVERTPTLLRAGFQSSSLIRWRDSLLQKYGGWSKFYPYAVGGVPRDLRAWQDLNNNDWLAIATTQQIAAITSGALQNITPQILVSDFTPDFSTTASSNVVEIVDNNITDVTIDDAILLNTPIAVGGLILSGLYQIASITGAHSYTILAAANATSTDTPGAVPQFDTTSGSATVLVTLPAHGQVIGNIVEFPIATTGGGVTVLGSYKILTVPTVNTFTIAVNVLAASTTTFFMNGGDAEIEYKIALGPQAAGIGFGLGGFGDGGFGTGTVPNAQAGDDLSASSWTSGNWGEVLIECPLDGPIYYWQPGAGFQTMSIVPAAPPYNTGIFISNIQQILIAYGSSVPVGIGVQQQPLLVQWSDVGNFFEWTASSETQAGNFTLSAGSKIVGGLSVSNQNLLWTDTDLWAMNYIGPPDVFGFNKIGAGMGLVSAHAIQFLRGAVFWMGPTNFYVYSGGAANVIPCPVWDAVFQNLNTNYLDNICAMPNTPFNEIGFLYPSAASSGENDSYVKMNISEPGAPWDYGPINAMPRSAWIDQSILGMPISASPSGVIYNQETTTDADGSPLTTTATTGYFYLEEGENFVYVDQIMPDFKWGTFAGSQTAQIQLTFNVTNFPGDTPRVYGPYTVTQATEYLNVRFRGRLMSVTISSNDTASFWRIGSIKFRYAPSGRR